MQQKNKQEYLWVSGSHLGLSFATHTHLIKTVWMHNNHFVVIFIDRLPDSHLLLAILLVELCHCGKIFAKWG